MTSDLGHFTELGMIEFSMYVNDQPEKYGPKNTNNYL